MRDGVPLKPPAVPTATALSVIDPRFVGRQEHETAWLEPEPVVALFLQPAMVFPFARKVTLELWLTFMLTVIALRYVAVKTDPASANELNVGAVTGTGRFPDAILRLYLLLRYPLTVTKSELESAWLKTISSAISPVKFKPLPPEPMSMFE